MLHIPKFQWTNSSTALSIDSFWKANYHRFLVNLSNMYLNIIAQNMFSIWTTYQIDTSDSNNTSYCILIFKHLTINSCIHWYKSNQMKYAFHNNERSMKWFVWVPKILTIRTNQCFCMHIAMKRLLTYEKEEAKI